MLNSNDWRQRHDPFINESRTLLYRCEECVTHLEMIAGDEDAIQCLHASLLSLTEQAAAAALDTVADFTRQLQRQLDSLPAGILERETLQTLRHCLGLLAWQLELIDPCTGELPMDDHEQRELLARLGGNPCWPRSIASS